MENKLLIGSHVSNNGDLMMLGSVKEALLYNSTALMLYLGAPQNTYRKSKEFQNSKEAISFAKEAGIDVEHMIVHALYVCNLANPDIEKREYAIDVLTREVLLTEACGLKYLVLHPGAHMNEGPEKGIKYIAEGLNIILSKTKSCVICLETMAGKGSEVGKTFEEINSIRELISDKYKERVKVCLDTCHINDGGYDLVNHYEDVVNELDRVIGIDNIKVIHLNDSKNELSSHKDRHENIGFGTLGFETILKVAYDERFKDIPKILETPYVDGVNPSNKKISVPPYKAEISMIRSKVFNPNLKEDLILLN